MLSTFQKAVFVLFPFLGIMHTPLGSNESSCTYCLGPENNAVHAPVLPRTCGGFLFTVAGLYWNASQEGMEYAIDTQVSVPIINPSTADIEQLNHLLHAHFLAPHPQWNFGFKFGLAHTLACDGLDLELQWTHYASLSPASWEASENQSFLTLWSSFSPAQGETNYARGIDADWKVQINQIDLELGRAFWSSQFLSFRPHAGIRWASIEQDLNLSHRGGSWSPRTAPAQDPFNNTVDLDNDFIGVGIRGGMNSIYYLSGGWGLFGNFAASLLYGRFHLTQNERNALSVSPYSSTQILSLDDRFRTSRAILDLALGIQWSQFFFSCRYGITALLSWEHHLFFHQNQLGQVNRIGQVNRPGDTLVETPNLSGENVFQQRSGSLSTQGWTLSFLFEF